jgi:hypothetical protein
MKLNHFSDMLQLSGAGANIVTTNGQLNVKQGGEKTAQHFCGLKSVKARGARDKKSIEHT